MVQELVRNTYTANVSDFANVFVVLWGYLGKFFLTDEKS